MKRFLVLACMLCTIPAMAEEVVTPNQEVNNTKYLIDNTSIIFGLYMIINNSIKRYICIHNKSVILDI